MAWDRVIRMHKHPVINRILPVSGLQNCCQSSVSFFANLCFQGARAAPVPQRGSFFRYVAEPTQPGRGPASLSMLVKWKTLQCLVTVSAAVVSKEEMAWGSSYSTRKLAAFSLSYFSSCLTRPACRTRDDALPEIWLGPQLHK